MITGELKSKVDAIWNAMWTGGLSNPQTVMEQLTLLLFLKGLDEAQTRAERQARARGLPLPPRPSGWRCRSPRRRRCWPARRSNWR